MLWNNVFMCNIPHIDAQHKALFEQIERIGAMHGDLSRIPETLEFLSTYTTEHFSDEQSLHEQTRYPQALAHRRQHESFVNQIATLKKEYEQSGHNLTNLMSMNHALVDWLKEHVLNSDKEFSHFFHALPNDKKKTLRLPRRPWIPESTQSFYREVTGIRVKEEPVAESRHSTARLSSSWTDSLLCGIPAIDDQHKELFRQIDLLKDQGNKERVPMVLRFLADYVVKHFNDEEAIHRKSRYPQAQGHRKLHEEFVKTFYESKERFDKSDGDFKSLMEVNKLVYDWLREHVMKLDKEFAKYYLALYGNEEGGAQEGVPDSSDTVAISRGGTTVVDRGTTTVRRGTTIVTDGGSSSTTIRGGTTVVAGRGTTVSEKPTSSWTDTLLCGIPHIDEQHKELFRQVDILRDQGNKERVPMVLNFLADYVVKHFNDEEILHRKSGYPQAAQHRKLHEDFVKTFYEAKERIDKSNGDFKTLMAVNKIVYDWLREHVMKVDKAFAKYYLAL